MKLFKSFRHYLAERNFKFAEPNEDKKVLNEAVLGQAKQFWPNFSLADIIKVSFFSDDWTSESIFGKLTGKFPVKSVEALERAVFEYNASCSSVDSASLPNHRFALKYRNQEKTKFDGSSAKISVDREQLIVNYQGDDWKTIDELIKSSLKGDEGLFSYDEPIVKLPPPPPPPPPPPLPPTFKQMEFNLDEAMKTAMAIFKVSPTEGCSDEKASDMFGKIEAALKANKAAKVRRVKPTGELDITVTGTVFDLIQTFAVLKGDEDKFWKFMQMSIQTSDPVKALKLVGDSMPAGSMTFDDLMEEFKKQFDFSSDLGVTQKWLLNFAYGSIYKKHKKMTDADIDAVVKKAEADGHPIPADQVEQMRLKQMTKEQVEALATKECWGGDKTKAVLASLPNPEFGSVDEFCDYFKKNHLEQQIGNFSEIWQQQRQTLNVKKSEFVEKAEKAALAGEKWAKDEKEVKKRLDALENKIKDEWALKLQLPEVKNLWQLQSLIDWHGSVEEIAAKATKTKEIVQTKPNHATKGSERRMKLFYAAQHADPNTEIIQTADWVVAVCRSAKATAPFGRLKPKVIKGTNDVDPACNLEDWEGITATAKEWRDNPTMDEAAYVRDGVTDEHGHNFDTILGEHGQTTVKNAHIFCETAWCFTGVLGGQWGWSDIKGSSDFNKYSESSTRPILIMMDTKRGALYAYAHFRKGNQELENFLNENEKCDGDPKNGTNPSDSRQKEFLEKFKASHQAFNALLAQLNRKYYSDFVSLDELEYDDYKAGEVKNAIAVNGAHPAAIRRLKLFKAAEHWGATIIKTPKWIVAVCAGNQIQPFGRYKPIASKDDPSKPDPKYNLEDWEGITPEAKSIRDRINYPACEKYDCVKDGMNDGYGISFDHLKARSQQSHKVKYAESCWCVCGTLSPGHFVWTDHAFKYGQFDWYTQGSSNRAFVLMNMAKGTMYLWTVNGKGNDCIANEQDSMDGIDEGKPGNNELLQLDYFNDKVLPFHPELRDLIEKLRKRYCGKIAVSFNSQISMTPEQLVKNAKESGNVSPNGALILNSVLDVNKYKPVFGKFNRIIVNITDCSDMFKSANLINVRHIDFSGIAKSLDSTFHSAQIGIIDIIGTYNVTSFAHCFDSSVLDQLTGIDTSSAKTIDSMFYNVKTNKNGMLRLPVFNLKNCHCIDKAFSNTNAVNVKLENIDAVTSAIDAYTYCPYLVNYPQTLFPAVTGLKKLTAGNAFIDMFAGCDQLMNSDIAPIRRDDKGEIIKDAIGFDELLKQTEDYYSGKEVGGGRFDDDGYYRVETPDSIGCEYYKENAQKISKIRIHSDIGVNFFNDIDVYAKTIDLNGMEDASLLFAGAKFKRIPTLEGCEKVTDVSGMFKKCLFAIAPNLDLPSVRKFRDIFSDCDNLHQLPKMNVGRNFDDKYSELKGLAYVFGGEGHHDGAAEKCGKTRLETFCSKLLEGIVGEIKVPGEKTDGKGNKTFEPRTSELEAEHGSVKTFFEKLAYSAEKPEIGKIIVDTQPDNMFAEIKSKDLSLRIEFDAEKMNAHSGEWQPTCMFRNVDVKSIELLNWPASFDDVRQMFYKASVGGAFPDFDMSGIRCAAAMFDEAKAGKPMANVPELGSLAIGSYMFRLSSGVLPAAGFKTSEFGFSDKLYTAEEMFANVKGGAITVDVLPQGIVQAGSMFAGTPVVSVGVVSLPKAENCARMFYSCADLTAVGVFSTTGCSANAFSDCAKLERVTYLDLPTFVYMNNMFDGCKKLTNIAWYNLNKGNISPDMFKDCPLAGLFGTSMEKYKNSKYVQKIPEKVKNMVLVKVAE